MLERIHDVYGMPREALIRILPPELKRWTYGADPAVELSTDPTTEQLAPTRLIGQPGGGGARSNCRAGEMHRRDPGVSFRARPSLSEGPEAQEVGGARTPEGPWHHRYTGFQETVTINATTGARHGRIMHPAGWGIRRVVASTAAEFA